MLAAMSAPGTAATPGTAPPALDVQTPRSPTGFQTPRTPRSGGQPSYLSRSSGQGPFKPSTSTERAIFGLRQAVDQVRLALGRIDPEAADLDGTVRGNNQALLAGIRLLIDTAQRMEENAKKYLGNLEGKGVTATLKTPKHKDPRGGLKSQLQSVVKVARVLLGDLLRHESVLVSHCAQLSQRLGDLEVVWQILTSAVDAESFNSLTKSAPRSPRVGGTSVASAAELSTTEPPPAFASSPGARKRWARLHRVLQIAGPMRSTAAASSTAGFSARTAVAGPNCTAPWSPEEDFCLIELVKANGLHRWSLVSDGLTAHLQSSKLGSSSRPPRTSGVCKARWESLLHAYLSVANASNVRRTAELLNAARKAGRDAETIMNEAAGRLTESRSALSLAAVAAQQLTTEAAEHRGWLRENTHVVLHGQSEEHKALRQHIELVGIKKLLMSKLEETERLQAGVEGETIARRLGLRSLVIEVGRLNGGAGAKPRHFLRVRNQESGEICLTWEEPSGQRATNPAGRAAAEADGLTRKLHGGAAANPPGGVDVS